jgi:hypothetical protein
MLKNFSPYLIYASYKEFGDLDKYIIPSLYVNAFSFAFFILDLFKLVK